MDSNVVQLGRVGATGGGGAVQNILTLAEQMSKGEHPKFLMLVAYDEKENATVAYGGDVDVSRLVGDLMRISTRLQLEAFLTDDDDED